jgi:hypothetical protein
MEPPKRLQGVEMDAYSSKNELFKAETKFWEDIIDGYIRVFKWSPKCNGHEGWIWRVFFSNLFLSFVSLDV